MMVSHNERNQGQAPEVKTVTQLSGWDLETLRLAAMHSSGPGSIQVLLDPFQRHQPCWDRSEPEDERVRRLR